MNSGDIGFAGKPGPTRTKLAIAPIGMRHDGLAGKSRQRRELALLSIVARRRVFGCSDLGIAACYLER